MPWLARTATAVVLTLSTVMLPAVRLMCVETCKAHAETGATSVPSCHETDSSGSQLRRLPSPCLHGHDGAIAAIDRTSELTRAGAPTSAVLVLLPDVESAIGVDVISSARPPGVEASPRHPLLSLRI